MRFWKYRDRDGDVVDEDGVARPVAVAPVVAGPTLDEVKKAEDDAYAKGRRDERSTRRSHPIITLVVLILAIVGAAFVYLSIRNGSMSAGGSAADRAAAQAKAEAPGAIHSAGRQVSQAAQNVTAQVHDATSSDSAPPASQ